jgi:hypothetical protein
MAIRQQREQTGHSGRRLYPVFVVDGTANPLFAAKISFGCLNRRDQAEIGSAPVRLLPQWQS